MPTGRPCLGPCSDTDLYDTRPSDTGLSGRGGPPPLKALGSRGDELLRLARETGATIPITRSLDGEARRAARVGVRSARPRQSIDVGETGWPAKRAHRIASDATFETITARVWPQMRDEPLKTTKAQR